MKRFLSVLCILCLVACAFPVMAIAAEREDFYLKFNSTDWSGNTEQINEEGRFYSVGNASSKNKWAITYNTPIDLGENFAVTTYINALKANSNRYGEYNALVLGGLELREYNDEYVNNAGAEVGVYTLKLVYNESVLATADMDDPNHNYSIVKQDGLIRVMLDNAFITLTDINGKSVNGVSASGMTFSAVKPSVVLHSNYYNGRYAQGMLIDRNYTSHLPNTDVNYPHESLYIIDPNNENSVITYMNTATVIPTGTDNKVVKYNLPGTYFGSDIWQAVPMISQELIDRGYIEGGEACQAIASLVVSSDDRLAMFGTDISGIYRSLDGGNHWQSCTIGLDAGGATGIAIDPKNPDHVIIVGCNTGGAPSSGLFVTTNALGQCEWTKGLSVKDISGGNSAITTHNDYRIQIVYDLNSYNASKGYCTTAYWSVEDKVIEKNGVSYPQQAMWKTTDGGFSWVKLEKAVGTIYLDGVAQADSAFLAGAEMASYTVDGTFYMYAATDEGFYISTDGGKNWTETLNSYGVYANAIDVIETEVAGHDASAVGKVWITTDNAMYRSDDFGYTWNKIEGFGYPVKYTTSGATFTPENISVSSLNPDNIYVSLFSTNGSGWYSNNGGLSWAKSQQQRGRQVTWQPVTGTRPYGYWSNTYENTFYAYANGIWKSVDGGKNIKWSNAGYNAIMVAGKWNFNVNHPNLVAFAAQDYNGGYSTDGGETWTYLNWAGLSWGGHTYGAYMLNEKTIFVTQAAGWTEPRYIWTTFDAGKTFNDTGLLVEGLTTGMGCLGDDKVAFMGEWRTEDAGKSWQKMASDTVTGSIGCMGVLAIDMKRGTLFGANGTRLVYSTDKGLTWYQIATVGGNIDDIAYDNESGKIYVTANDTLYTCYVDFNNNNNLLSAVEYAETLGNTSVADVVAVDPNNPNVVYVGGNGNINYQSYDMGGVYRSLDRGETWTCLTRQVDDGRDLSPDGGKKATSMRVNPATGELFVATGCRGVWKMEPPAQWYLDSLTDDGKTAQEPVDHTAGLSNNSKKDLMETGKYANYSGYTPKTVTLELINKDAGVEYGYFKVPDGVVIHAGDNVKLGCSKNTAFTMPDGVIYNGIAINTTSVKGKWTHSKQVCADSTGAHVFTEPGYYTLYVISSKYKEASGYALVSFYVADPYEGYTEIKNASDLQKVKSNLNGNYILTADISVSNWTSIGSATSSFNGVFYGNGHKISGLTAPLFANNNGGVSHIDLSDSPNASVATVNNSYIAYCKVSGAIASTNNGTVKNCLVCPSNTTVVVGENNGSVNGCYYASGMSAIGSGTLADTDVNYTYTDITDASQFDNLDDNWYQAIGSAPTLVVERGYTKQTFYDIFKDYVIEDGYLYVDCLGNPVDMFIGEYSFEGATLAAYAPDGT
ncbi:MAG: hypothetical protein IJF58_01590, partial [Clostridia bacterium]|nr:hypothetical protein [Clostridia bacterium]